MSDATTSLPAQRGPLTARFDEAFLLAHDLHRDQPRKGTDTPYISHLIAVASLVLEAGGDEETAIAALLHDAIEDQGDKINLEQIEVRFGSRVAGIVRDCTDAYTQPKPPWKQRKLDYVAHVPSLPADSRLVCAADKLHNATAILRDCRTFGDATFERFKGGKEGTLWYQRAIADALAKAEENVLTRELNLVVRELESQCALVSPPTKEEARKSLEERERELHLDFLKRVWAEDDPDKKLEIVNEENKRQAKAGTTYWYG